MGESKIIYRIMQFISAMGAKPSAEDLLYVKNHLNSRQYQLFTQLQKSEQTHAIAVCKMTEDQGHHHLDLMTACLLHDIGKIRFKIRHWERVFIVLARVYDPDFFEKRWPEEGKGFFRIYSIVAHHPKWGADLAKEAGASPLTVSLIQRHQDPLPQSLENDEDRFLAILQQNDNLN